MITGSETTPRRKADGASLIPEYFQYLKKNSNNLISKNFFLLCEAQV